MCSTRLLTTLLLLTVAALCAQGAAPSVRIRLHNEAVLPEGHIAIGQIADVEGETTTEVKQVAGINVGATPWPGNARRVTREHVAMHLARTGFDPNAVEWNGPQSCLVTVETARIEPDELVRAGREYLTSLPVFADENVQIEVRNMPRAQLVAGTKEEVTLVPSSASPGQPWGQLRVHVAVQSNDRVLATVPVIFLVSCRRNAVFTQRPVSRGDVFRAEDLEVREILLGPESAPEPYLTDASQAVGQQAARAVAANTAVSRSMLLKPLVVRKGEAVSIRLRSKYIEIVAKGVALQDGVIGDVVPVEVESSGKKLPCRAKAVGIVEMAL